MNRKRHLCECGWSGRADQVNKHQITCTASPIIKILQDENATLQEEVSTLKIKIDTLENLLKTSNVTINNQINNNPVINQIQQNITVYGKEELPNAFRKIHDTIMSEGYEECVPRYIEMKHFPDGPGNIRIDSERNHLEVFTEDKKWVRVDKESELSKLTLLNSQEIMERYGEGGVTSYFKNWAKRKLKDEKSDEFRDVKQRVEDVIVNNSE